MLQVVGEASKGPEAPLLIFLKQIMQEISANSSWAWKVLHLSTLWSVLGIWRQIQVVPDTTFNIQQYL